MTDLSLAARLQLDSQRWAQGLNQARSQTRGFVASVRHEFSELRGFMSGTTAKLAGLGASFATGTELMRSARMDKTLTQIGQTAGATREQVQALRGELFGMAKDTGQTVENLQQGFSTLVAGGLSFEESLPTMRAVNKAMAVTSASAETLAGTLGVAATAFQFDLSKPDQALELLDKMTVAGRKGYAELESLGSIFSRIGVNAGRAGLGFEQTLGFIEGLSLVERQPERLATLADSTLRLFTNAKYMRDAQKASGIRFFDKEGSRRDPLAVLEDFRKKFETFKTDAQRESFLSKAFGNADLDTIKGLSTLLSGDNLSKVNTFTAEITNAGGTLQKSLPESLSNAVDQAGRLKATLIDGADGFAQRLNQAFSGVTKKLLDKKSDGGMELGAGELVAGGAAGLLALYLGKRTAQGAGKKLLGGLLGGTASLGTGVAMGTALEKAGAATPVFIVGAAPGLLGGTGGGAGSALLDAGTGKLLRGAGARAAPLLARLALLGGSSVGSLAGAGATGAGAIAGGVGVAAAGGYATGTLIDKGLQKSDLGMAIRDHIGRNIAFFLAAFGNKEARESLESERRAMQLELNVKVDGGTATVTSSRGSMFTNVRSGSSSSSRGRMMHTPRAGHE